MTSPEDRQVRTCEQFNLQSCSTRIRSTTRSDLFLRPLRSTSPDLSQRLKGKTLPAELRGAPRPGPAAELRLIGAHDDHRPQGLLLGGDHDRTLGLRADCFRFWGGTDWPFLVCVLEIEAGQRGGDVLFLVFFPLNTGM